MRRLVGVIGALLVHLFVVIPFFIPSCTPMTPPPTAAPSQDNEVVVLIHPITKVPSDEEPPPPRNGQNGTWMGDDCPDKTKIYEGIGIIYDPSTGRVLQAPPSLPAYRAGVRVGDVFVNAYPGGSNGIHNGIAEFDFFRSATRFTLKIPTEKICFEGSRQSARVNPSPHQ
jgi:hypothetical protein